MVIDGVPVSGHRLQVKPIDDLIDKTPKPLVDQSNCLNNLYVKDLPKHVTALQVRRVFARYGKISSFNLIDKPNFTTNIAYVGYQTPAHASCALTNISSDGACEKELGKHL